MEKWKENHMLTQLGHVEAIKSIEANCKNSLCCVLFKKEYKGFDGDIIGKILLQSLAEVEGML